MTVEPLIVYNEKLCIGCHSCEIACQLENNAPVGIMLRHVTSEPQGVFPEEREWIISTACFHCNDPSCVSACPAGALKRRDNGVVEHIQKNCIGCGYCINACPFDVPQFSPSQHIMRKCSFCTQRIDVGKEPACVAKCPTGALKYLTDGNLPKDMPAAYGKSERLHMVYALTGKPSEYHLPEPVPGNNVTHLQIFKWLIGLVPGAFLLGWFWKKLSFEEDNLE